MCALLLNGAGASAVWAAPVLIIHVIRPDPCARLRLEHGEPRVPGVLGE